MGARSRGLTIFAATIFATGAAFGDVGTSGQKGESGTAGRPGQAGTIGGIEAMYKWYPLCSLASLIAAAHDQNKLREYLTAGCSTTQIADHTGASMFTYTLTRQEPELLELILADPKAGSEVDVFTVVPAVDEIEGVPVKMNPFELTIYNRLIDRNSPSKFAEKSFDSLYVDENQIEMTKLLLSAAKDGAKLTEATSQILQKLRDSSYKSHPNILATIHMIESRVAELSR